ncbi:MAG: hypothetical protein JWR60_2280 [Polaromonas sp.]|nr:hypothetical protein [Polaromonas sp.]
MTKRSSQCSNDLLSVQGEFSPCTQCPMRIQCAGKPLLPARPICKDGHRIVTRDFHGRVDL